MKDANRKPLQPAAPGGASGALLGGPQEASGALQLLGVLPRSRGAAPAPDITGEKLTFTPTLRGCGWKIPGLLAPEKSWPRARVGLGYKLRPRMAPRDAARDLFSGSQRRAVTKCGNCTNSWKLQPKCFSSTSMVLKKINPEDQNLILKKHTVFCMFWLRVGDGPQDLSV